MIYDITVGYQMSGKNQFGDVETLQASQTFTIENETKERAIEIAKSRVRSEVKSVSVCERK